MRRSVRGRDMVLMRLVFARSQLVLLALDGQHLLWGGSVLHVLHVGADDPAEYVVTDGDGTNVRIGAVVVAP